MPKKANQTNKQASKQNSTATAKEKMDNLKYEIAREVGVPLKEGYNGDLTSAQNGKVGGNMVKKMIEDQKNQM